jgi:hypothetical protein
VQCLFLCAPRQNVDRLRALAHCDELIFCDVGLDPLFRL